MHQHLDKHINESLDEETISEVVRDFNSISHSISNQIGINLGIGCLCIFQFFRYISFSPKLHMVANVIIQSLNVLSLYR